MLSAKKELFTPSGGGYQISRSVRLRSSASAYLSRTFGTPTSNTTWTYSVWVKRSRTGANETLLTRTSDVATMYFESGTDQLVFWTNTQTESYYRTSRRFRDPSAWMHIVWIYNTTNATQADRSQLWINGVRETAFATSSPQPSLNATSGGMNASVSHTIGGPSNLLDGYLTEINFIDGQALTPSNFGEIDAITGVWKPKRYTGTYGNNGFYLNFSDNSGVTATTIGKDYSGNSNNWTPNNISVTAGVTYDSMLDVPTLYADGNSGRGNYCTLNPLYKGSSVTPTEGNLKFGMTAGNFHEGITGTIFPTSGKWYAEFRWNTVTAATTATAVCRNNAAMNNITCAFQNTVDTNSPTYRSYVVNGNKDTNTTSAAYGSTYTANDTIGVALDLDNGKVWFSKNGAWQASGDPAAGTNAAFTDITGSDGWTFGVSGYGSGGDNCHANFGQRPFAYTPPTGFVALNTQNLPTPTISNGASYMAATTYTGTGASQVVSNAVNGVSMQPDWVWFKRRNTAENHWLVDAIRGVSNGLFSNLTNVETSQPSTVSSFNSNGFTVGADTTGYTNANGSTYVAWQWNAGGSTVTNTSGSISAQVRANPTAGFSVVTYTGNGLTNQSVGHGLNATPGMVIIKQRSGTANWLVHHQSQPTGYTLYLNLTNAQDSGTSQWGTSPQTSSLFYVGFVSGATGSNVSASTYVAYCFAAVAGYSAFGSYTGNGSTDGPFVFLGFRPKFVMIKRTDAVDSGWGIKDSSRNEHNTMTASLFSNSSSAESAFAANKIDFLSNGFKIRDDTSLGYHNANGGTYIYMAFAENPFKNSLAR